MFGRKSGVVRQPAAGAGNLIKCGVDSFENTQVI